MPLGLLPCEFTEHTVKLCRDFRLLFYGRNFRNDESQ
jgi:hypothetical protein